MASLYTNHEAVWVCVPEWEQIVRGIRHFPQCLAGNGMFGGLVVVAAAVKLGKPRHSGADDETRHWAPRTAGLGTHA